MNDNTIITKKRLAVKGVIRFLSAVIIVACMLFLTAGTLDYWNGWVFMAAIFIPMFFHLIYLYRNDPELLAKRMKTEERLEKQKSIQKIGSVLIIAGFFLPGLDHRFGWSQVPFWLVVTSALLLVVSYYLTIVVMKQNSYASRVIEIQEHQTVIDSGLYSLVRHPMYLFSSLVFLSAPLVLGSLYAVIPMALYPVLLIIRLLNEEELLKMELPGYEEYMKKVRYRLLPFVW